MAVLSGPTFAREVALGLPTAVTLAADDPVLAEQLRDRLAQPTFRIYVSDDVAGAEIGGAVKNVLAIACGVVEGRGLGQNARAALIGRGFAEMTRFGLAFGAKRETLAGLSGLGDLVLTCSSTSSRNYSLGLGIGAGRPAAELLADRKTVAEGAFTAPVLARLAKDKGIDMPIVDAVDALDRRAGQCRSGAGRAAVAAAARRSFMIRGGSEIDRDPVLLPVAVAGRVEPLFLSGGRGGRIEGLGLRHGGRRAEIVRRIEVLWALHDVKMSIAEPRCQALKGLARAAPRCRSSMPCSGVG